MNTLWILLALCIGTMVGFFTFALMAMARENEREDSKVFAPRLDRLAPARSHRNPI